MTAQGIDISNYQKQFGPLDADCVRMWGGDFIIIGRQANNAPYAPGQAQAARNAGLHIAEYLISLNGAWPELFPETRIVAIDVEPGSEFTTEADIDNAILWVRSQGRTPAIYSSKWAWDALGLAAVTKYGEQGVLCWNAHYDGRSDGFALPLPYGGWTHCDIDQYTEKGRINGIAYDIDLNEARDGLFDATAPASDAGVSASPPPQPTAGAGEPVPFLSLQQSTELQYVLGRGAVALPRLVVAADADLTLYVLGQEPKSIPAGTLMREYRVLVPLDAPADWKGI